jgi:hypothetical protein
MAELTPAERAERRRRLAEVFGESLPEQTTDDAADPAEAGATSSESVREEWLKRQVPPHHG